MLKTWKNNYVNIFKPCERPKKPSAVSNEHTYNVRVKRWRSKLQKYEERYRTFAQKKQKEYAKLVEAQAWLYNQVASSFSETGATCIKWYEPSIFVDELLKEDPKLGFTDFRVKVAPCGSLCLREIIQSYKNVGHTDAIIKNSRWQATIHSSYSELKDKHSDSDVIQIFTKELSLQFDDVQSTMEAYSFSELADIQTLMGILATY